MLDYLAPEQIEGRAADGRTDQYSLACAAFEFLCGMPPFGPDQGQTLMYAQIYADPPAASARRAGIPSAIDSVLATALAKDPAGRYPSCGRFAEELRAALGLRPGEPADPPQSPASRGNGPVSWPWPASVGLRDSPVRKKQRPGAEDAHAAAKDSHTVAADRPSRERARWYRPAPTIRPAGSGQARSRRGRSGPARVRAVPIPNGPPGGSAPAGPCWRSAPWSLRPPRSYPVSSCRGDRPPPTRPQPPPRRLPPRRPRRQSSPSATSSPTEPVAASQQAAALKELLTSSAAARTTLHNAVTQVVRAPTCPARSASSRPS